jgi:DNA-binding FrmR family transcriptional regulator
MEKAKRARKAETPKQAKPLPKVARAVPLSRLHDHVAHCVEPANASGSAERRKIAELMAVLSRTTR